MHDLSIKEKMQKTQTHKGEFILYVGPPFPDGSPHYGHLFTLILKDCFIRLNEQRGNRPCCRWGWDDFGVNPHNINISGWPELFDESHFAFSLKNPYRSSDKSYMESVWWVFHTLYIRGLICDDKDGNYCVKVDQFHQRFKEILNQVNWIPESALYNVYSCFNESPHWKIAWCKQWGNPVPIWTNGEETLIVGSFQDLRQLANQPDLEITMESLDKLEIPSSLGGPPLRRVRAVFDSYFEAGCMPYATQHYPFKITKEQLFNTMPADLIVEGNDQTKGWFYSLNVISTALFDRPAVKNVIVNGLLLGEDSRKLSKKYKNYSSPLGLIREFNMDSMRLYLISLRAVRGVNCRFDQRGPSVMNKHVLSPLQGLIQTWISQKDHNFMCTFKQSRITGMIHNWILHKVSLFSADLDALSYYQLSGIISKLIGLLKDIKKYILIETGESLIKNSVFHKILATLITGLYPIIPSFSLEAAKKTHIDLFKRELFMWPISSKQLELTELLIDTINIIKHFDHSVRPGVGIVVSYTNHDQLKNLKAIEGQVKKYTQIEMISYVQGKKYAVTLDKDAPYYNPKFCAWSSRVIKEINQIRINKKVQGIKLAIYYKSTDESINTFMGQQDIYILPVLKQQIWKYCKQGTDFSVTLDLDGQNLQLLFQITEDLKLID